MKVAWSAGWAAGMTACKTAASAFDWNDVLPSASFRDRREWSADQVQAYELGYQTALASADPEDSFSEMPRRYRGTMRQFLGWWERGRLAGLREWRSKAAVSGSPSKQQPERDGPERAKSKVTRKRHPVTVVGKPTTEETGQPRTRKVSRHPVTPPSRSSAAGGEPEPARPRPSSRHQVGDNRQNLAGRSHKRPPKAGVDRQREYRARKRLRSIDVSAETHALLRQVCTRDGVGVDAALRAALEAVLAPGTGSKR